MTAPRWIAVHDLDDQEWQVALRVGGTDEHWTVIATVTSRGWAERIAKAMNGEELPPPPPPPPPPTLVNTG